VSSKWTFHTGRVNHLAFSPSGKRLASAGADESIYVWEVEKTLKNTPIKVSIARPSSAPALRSECTPRWSIGSGLEGGGDGLGQFWSGRLRQDVDCRHRVDSGREGQQLHEFYATEKSSLRGAPRSGNRNKCNGKAQGE
jgi:WD40 repeat protein